MGSVQSWFRSTTFLKLSVIHVQLQAIWHCPGQSTHASGLLRASASTHSGPRCWFQSTQWSESDSLGQHAAATIRLVWLARETLLA